jgi:hypothetical protein
MVGKVLGTFRAAFNGSVNHLLTEFAKSIQLRVSRHKNVVTLAERCAEYSLLSIEFKVDLRRFPDFAMPLYHAWQLLFRGN